MPLAHRDHPIDCKLSLYAPTVKQPVLRYVGHDQKLQYAGVRERQLLQFSAYGENEESFPYAWVCPDPKCNWQQDPDPEYKASKGEFLWWGSSNAFGPVSLKQTRDLKAKLIRKHNSKLHFSELIISDPKFGKSTIDRCFSQLSKILGDTEPLTFTGPESLALYRLIVPAYGPIQTPDMIVSPTGNLARMWKPITVYVDKTAGDEALGYKQWFKDTIGTLPKGPNYLVSLKGYGVAGRLALVDKVVVEPVAGFPTKVLMTVGMQDWQCPWADNVFKRRPALEQGYPEINQQQHLCLIGDAWNVECVSTLTAAREWATSVSRLPLQDFTQEQAAENTHYSITLMTEALDLIASDDRVRFGQQEKDMQAVFEMENYININHCNLVEAQLSRAVGQGMTALSGLLEIVRTFTRHPEFTLAECHPDSMDI